MNAETLPERILNHMRLHPNTVVTRDRIAEIIYGQYWNSISKKAVNNYINLCISFAKTFLKEGEQIEAVRGVGYEYKSKG